MSRTRQMALTGLCTALAVVFSLLEAALPTLPMLPLGVKPGLGNIVVAAMAGLLPVSSVVFLSLTRAGLALAARGVTAGLMSLCGGLLSSLLMWRLLRARWQPSYLFVSLAGAIAHNLVQLAVASVLFGSLSVFYYLPPALVGAVVFGGVNGMAARALAQALCRTSAAFTRGGRRQGSDL